MSRARAGRTAQTARFWDALSEIQDPEMQTIERVMFTNALLGKPMKNSTVSQKKKNGNWMSSTLW